MSSYALEKLAGGLLKIEEGCGDSCLKLAGELCPSMGRPVALASEGKGTAANVIAADGCVILCTAADSNVGCILAPDNSAGTCSAGGRGEDDDCAANGAC